MLIDKGITPGQVVTLKTIGGEEIIAKLVEEKENTYLVNTPMMFVTSPQGLAMSPFMFSANPEKDVAVNKSSLVCISTSDPGFADTYLSSTTGITVGEA